MGLASEHQPLRDLRKLSLLRDQRTFLGALTAPMDSKSSTTGSAGHPFQSLYDRLTFVFEEVQESDTGQAFLVDLDSLLLELALDPLVDWSHGGQMLHIFYSIEHTLHRMRQRGRKLKVFAFECMEVPLRHRRRTRVSPYF